MIRHAVIAASFSAKVYSKHAMPAGAPQLAMHEFGASADGQLEHHINGELRATVPPEGFEAYVEAWPDCRPIVEQLTRPATQPDNLSGSDAPGN